MAKSQYTAFLNGLKMLDRRGYKTISGKLPSSTAGTAHVSPKIHTPADIIVDEDDKPVFLAFKSTEKLTCQKDLIKILLNILKHVSPDGSHPTISSAKLADVINRVKAVSHPIVFYHNNHRNLSNVQQLESNHALKKHELEIFQVRYFAFDIFDHVYQPKMTRMNYDHPEIVAMRKQYSGSKEPRTKSTDMAARYFQCVPGKHYLKVERPGVTLYRKVYRAMTVAQESDDEDDEVTDDEEEVSKVETEKQPETNNLMTTKEYVKLIGVRGAQLQEGAPHRLTAEQIKGISDVLEIAKIEVKAGVCPLKIIRHLPNGNMEVFKIRDMVLGKISAM